MSLMAQGDPAKPFEQRNSISATVAPLPELPASSGKQFKEDYLVHGVSRSAAAFRSADGLDLILDNGLIRRTWRITPNAACIGFRNLTTDQEMVRSVRPEARVTINGVDYPIGGLVGQPNHAFLTPNWIDEMQADPQSFQLVDVEIGQPVERFGWKRRRHTAPDAAWPPKGISLSMTYAMPRDEHTTSTQSNTSRKPLWTDDFQQLSNAWSVQASPAHPRISFVNEGKTGEIYALSGTHCFAQRSLSEATELVEVVIDPGSDTATSWGPGMAWCFQNAIIKFNLRPGDRGEHGHFELRVNGRERLASIDQFSSSDNGLAVGKTYRLRMRLAGPRFICEAAIESETSPTYFQVFELSRDISWGKPKTLRVGKMDRQGKASDEAKQPDDLTRCRIIQAASWGPADAQSVSTTGNDRTQTAADSSHSLNVKVHYELYDGLPVMSKWISLHNQTADEITIDRFTGEELALVEQTNWVETRDSVDIPRPDSLHIETDFAFGGFNHENANRHVIHWRPDPLYKTQVNYTRKTPCLLVAEPTNGPAQKVAAGDTFEGFRVFELAFDNGNRERRGLAMRRMYRTIAPWVTENPITHHLLSNDPQRVREAIDQAAEVGFEAIILSFGSGFNMENQAPQFLTEWRAVADYAAEKQIELGCYSLFSSRGITTSDMIVSPTGQKPTHGRCPAVTSLWGQQWLKTISEFYDKTGFDQFENDGPYPGDIDVTPRPPFQEGALDSRWTQWRMTSNLYRKLRERGVYINAPDYYFLSGSNKCGMGYREVNWSLPRAHQVLHTRQNIYDGTWTKTPSMGWMFVPLSQYHGGGSAATIEPLHQHLDHYKRIMQSNFALGVQAHYRGPRLYDTEETRIMVRSAVHWFKQYREILESDVIHGRRADGRDVDWMLHVNPRLKHKGMLCVFNPLKAPVDRILKVDLYYTGLTHQASVSHEGASPQAFPIGPNHCIALPVHVPAESMAWFVVE